MLQCITYSQISIETGLRNSIKKNVQKETKKNNVYLIQLSGSFLQSVLHLNRSQASQPMGGVFTRPFSRANVKSATDTIKHHIHIICDILQKRTRFFLTI